MAEPVINVLGIVSIKNRGTYDASTTYEKLNVVTYQGSSYCAKGTTQGNLPTDELYWDLMVEKGDKGDTGAVPVKGVDYYTAADISDLEATLSEDVSTEVSSQLSELTSATPLVASSTADMTDTTRIYVNTTDGHWYWYDDGNTTWVDGGTYQATEISDDSIETSMLKDKSLIVSKLEQPLQDLISVSNVNVDFERESRSYYNRNTHEKASTSTMSSTLINVEPGEKYYITAKATISSNICAVMFFNNNDEYVSYLQDSPYDWDQHEVVVPAGARKMGVSFLTNDGATIKKKEIKIKKQSDVYTLQDITKHILDNDNYKIVLLGDSITAGVGGTGFSDTGASIITISGTTYKRNENGYCWANLMKKYLETKYSNIVVVNNGISGMKSNLISAADYNRLPALVGDADLVICMFGTNDRGQYTKANTYNFLTPMIEYCRLKKKQLIYMCPIPGSIGQDAQYNYHYEDVADSIKQLCLDNNIPYIDFFTKFKEYCLYNNISMDDLRVDSLHPNDRGYRIMFEIIMKELNISTPQPGATWIDLDYI